jgi:hypothetical protein
MLKVFAIFMLLNTIATIYCFLTIDILWSADKVVLAFTMVILGLMVSIGLLLIAFKPKTN